MSPSKAPLVSIFSFCRNSEKNIERSIRSVLNQNYENIEFVIQDGASTDGTLGILERFAGSDSRIKLVSAPDSGPAEAFKLALRRCQGEIIGSCLSDEELLPGAIERVVTEFSAHPNAGAITGDGYITNANGDVVADFDAGAWDYVSYLFGRYSPLWAASFFRRTALENIGLHQDNWHDGCLEFDLWVRMGADYEVASVPVRLAKYGIHDSQLSNTPKHFMPHLNARLELIEEIFSESGFFSGDAQLLKACKANQLGLYMHHARAYGHTEAVEELQAKLRALGPLSIAKSLAQPRPHFGQRLWRSLAMMTPDVIRYNIPRPVTDTVRNSVYGLAAALTSKKPHILEVLEEAPPLEEDDAYIRARVAQAYFNRGQIDEALRLWDQAGKLNNEYIDSSACQASLMSPTASAKDIAQRHAVWVSKHASSEPTQLNVNPRSSRIRIGYHCTFIESFTFRAQLMQSIAVHDRSKFEIYGYGHAPIKSDLESVFDHFRDTSLLKDDEFVKLCRSDGLDVLVETTGFSPGHRFAALAQRCAPVQVSYLNHSATSGVAAVDYVLADEIAIPQSSGEDVHFVEKIYRLPSCFFCFDYESFGDPPPGPLPFDKNGYITFCYFGSGGKLNTQLIEWWAQILHAVPGSIFFIRNGQLNSDENKRFVVARFARFGIAADRLRIEGGTNRAGILASYAEADISLDSWPYCGGNTVAEAVWQGVPVVSLIGERFSSRYGASLVAASGLPELVGNSPAEYVNAARMLAADPERLRYLRRNLRQMYKLHGLGDSVRLARILEEAFVDMLQRAESTAATPEKHPLII